MRSSILFRGLSAVAAAVVVFGSVPAYARALSPGSFALRRMSRRMIRALPRRSVQRRFSHPASSAAASSVSSAPAGPRDPDADVSLQGRVALLGSTSPVLGSVRAFSNAEPLSVTSITVTLQSAASSVDHLLLYDHDGIFLASARLDAGVSGGKTYTANLRTRDVVIPHREEYSFYIRAALKTRGAGGMSAESIKVASVALEANGAWSNRAYTQSLTGTFNAHQTARSIIASITNAGAASEPLFSGSDREIGKFRFSGVRGDGGADLRLTQLTFTLSTTGGVAIDDVQIVSDGGGDRALCTVASPTITCALSAAFGSLTSGPRTLTLLGDVTVPSTAARASLQISLNEPGDTVSAGAIEWTDGSTIFTWVGFEAPVARGTYYSY